MRRRRSSSWARRRLGVAVVALVIPGSGGLEAQFSSDFPGIPRASINQFGTSQGRFELDFAGMTVGAGEEPDGSALDSLSLGLRFGFGKSWRVGSRFEAGFDLSVADGRLVRLSASSEPGGLSASDTPENRMEAMAAYGLRLGMKFTPISYVDPDGYGFSTALGVGFQPGIAPGMTLWKEGDSTVFKPYGSGGEEGSESLRLHAARQLMMAGSYRHPRGELDLALFSEGVMGTDSLHISPLSMHEGTGFRVGGRIWVTRSLGVGLAYWGGGAPAWRDRVPLGEREGSGSSHAFLLSWGRLLEKGGDLMIASPTGDFTESWAVGLRMR